jgi:hypothetical protein
LRNYFQNHNIGPWLGFSRGLRKFFFCEGKKALRLKLAVQHQHHRRLPEQLDLKGHHELSVSAQGQWQQQFKLCAPSFRSSVQVRPVIEFAVRIQKHVVHLQIRCFFVKKILTLFLGIYLKYISKYV